ncbi:hypothetical protein [Pelosinus sp. IPA-1]|uniref:hypothetical protein n=1 Tax=Pelosinus sp. IPA-1 TaxID=3029569 RepID=UPI0024361690|nr:hypothetical protein [Pelosinus sp. IPA-1]GMA98012.1 hypothetical protein PIPA1_08120 [Pelosinus sp. IPA-1]
MKLKHYTAGVVLSATLAFTTPVGVDAASVTTSTVTASIGDVSISSSKTEASGGNIRFAQVLSSNYNRTVSPVEVIRLRTDFDFGLGEISLIYAAAVYSGRPVDEISRYRHENMGWGEIAKMYGVKVKDLKKSNEDVVNAARLRGVDVTYIDIGDDDRDYDRHGDDHRGRDNDREDKSNHKKESKHDDKPNNGKGKGNNK